MVLIFYPWVYTESFCPDLNFTFGPATFGLWLFRFWTFPLPLNVEASSLNLDDVRELVINSV